MSSIGASGERMVKIGLTRRLDPMDRVNELGDASVPFRFDGHALIFSEDAVGLERRLHQEFEDRRGNRVNVRREFFYTWTGRLSTDSRSVGLRCR
nr:GIY-YIG nuclease family protein [Streptomyces ambofaciens]